MIFVLALVSARPSPELSLEDIEKGESLALEALAFTLGFMFRTKMKRVGVKDKKNSA